MRSWKKDLCEAVKANDLSKAEEILDRPNVKEEIPTIDTWEQG